jgi:glycosyltransferase involved in cell wall biosynthesis
MRILLVATDVQLPGNHGGSTHVAELFEGLSKRAATRLIAAQGSEGEGIVGLGQPLRRGSRFLRHTDALRLLPRALEEARRFKPDVIYERCSSYGLGAELSIATGAPLLTMVLDERYSWLSLMRANKLVATRLDLIPKLVRHKGCLVHWGANVERFDASIDATQTRAALGLATTDFVVGYAGSFKRWHGLSSLVEAAAHVSENARFLMVGDGPARPEIEALVSARGLTSRFLFLGSVPYEQVPSRLAASDVCVAPFDPEQHGPSRELGSFVLDPLKVFEYLALGKPTVTIRAENLLRIFDHKTHILLYEPGSVSQLAQALSWVKEQPDEAVAMARRGHELVLQKYTWQAHADHLFELFEGMLPNR